MGIITTPYREGWLELNTDLAILQYKTITDNILHATHEVCKRCVEFYLLKKSSFISSSMSMKELKTSIPNSRFQLCCECSKITYRLIEKYTKQLIKLVNQPSIDPANYKAERFYKKVITTRQHQKNRLLKDLYCLVNGKLLISLSSEEKEMALNTDPNFYIEGMYRNG